jgi:hypothetical protein
LILGSEIDPWIAVIAKMNMYFHGDGKSNIRHANGLTLATVASFAPERPMPLADAVDVVITNPPLGDIDFQTVAEGAAKAQLLSTVGAHYSDDDLARYASEWSSANLDVVPHKIVEEEDRRKALVKADEWRERVAEAKTAGDQKAEQRARNRVAEWQAKQQEADQRIGAGDITYRPAGRTAKGGALFLSSMRRCLKPIRDPRFPLNGGAASWGL